MGELKTQQEKLEGSVLCTEHGALFEQLVELNEQLRVKIEMYASILSGNPSEGWETVSQNDYEEVKPVSCTGAEGNVTDGAVFEAALPWEEEEEEQKEDFSLEK
ncbi:hypothetical protein DQ04_00271200 [Trypanosoma grayi]|uniref:hypothetical protein n=1 Tax=Trypanosoma grayi TaxID=71804 RepID=UPI0004F4496B|nr:hypothetical protein DQ04_00271200 [Trypanosoma grayi]KEG14886.1 hypothetical protein DQ04_00271200 [Trypanosoma grayi]